MATRSGARLGVLTNRRVFAGSDDPSSTISTPIEIDSKRPARDLPGSCFALEPGVYCALIVGHRSAPDVQTRRDWSSDPFFHYPDFLCPRIKERQNGLSFPGFQTRPHLGC